MRSFKGSSLFILFAALCSSHCFAGGENGCHEFSVQVTNKTNSACLLQRSETVKGKFLYANPQSKTLSPGESQTFYLRQGYTSGPMIVTDYICNGKVVSFASDQNYCFLAAGEIHGNLRFNDSNVKATFSSTVGSYDLNVPGRAYWSIENQN